MSMSVVESSFQVIPPQEPSTQHKGVHLHESIIKSFNLNQSQVHKSKLNNNSMPMIETDLLSTFNPQSFQPIQQPSLSYNMQTQRNVTSIPVRSLSQNQRVKVNFSYASNNQFPKMNIQNAFVPQVQRSTFGNGMNVISRRVNNFFPDQIRSHSMENNNRPFSNLSQLSKSKKIYPQTPVPTNPLNRFSQTNQAQNSQLVKTHKLGKKFKTIKFGHNLDHLATQKSHHSPINDKKSTNEFVEVMQSPRRTNMSQITMEKSQYVFLTEKTKQNIEIIPQEYVYSQKNINYLPMGMKTQQPNLNNKISATHHSMILPIEQEQKFSEINIRADQQHYVHYRKSPKKIDNRVYLEENEGLRTLEGKGSRLSSLDDLNKISQISIKNNAQHEVLIERNDILSKNVLNDLEKLSEEQNKVQNQEKQTQNQALMTRISELEEKLHQKEEENLNLQKRIQNQQLEKKLHTEYEKLQMMSKLNEIEIKKLKNEIKMFQIREKFYINSQKQRISQINELKRELQAVKKNSIQGLNGFGRHRITQSSNSRLGF